MRFENLAGAAHPTGGPSATVGGAAATAPRRQGAPLAGALRAAGPPTAARLGPPGVLAALRLPAGTPKPGSGPWRRSRGVLRRGARQPHGAGKLAPAQEAAHKPAQYETRCQRRRG